jgi:hypothetical protein
VDLRRLRHKAVTIYPIVAARRDDRSLMELLILLCSALMKERWSFSGVYASNRIRSGFRDQNLTHGGSDLIFENGDRDM